MVPVSTLMPVIHTRGRRLLDRPGPDVDRTILIELAFPGKWTGGGGERLDDQVVRFPVAAHQPSRIGISRRNLVRRAFDQTHFNPAAR